MRIRQVKPEYWEDVRLAEVPPIVRWVYIGLWNEADDSGWLRWDAKAIGADLMRHDDPQERTAIVGQAGDALEAHGRLRRFKCGHAFIPNLAKHQRLAGPTKQVHTFLREHEQCRQSRRSPRVPAVPRPVRLGKGRLGKVSSTRSRAGENEENGMGDLTPEQRQEAVEQNRRLVRDPKANRAARRAAFKTLERIGALEDADREAMEERG